MHPIERAIEIAGNQSELARRLGVTPQTVQQWVASLRPVPAKRVLAIEKATRGQVSRYDLRPDLYPREQA